MISDVYVYLEFRDYTYIPGALEHKIVDFQYCL